MKVCIVGASGKLGKYMMQLALDQGYEVVGVCRERSAEKLDAFKRRITVIRGATNDRDVIKVAVEGCDGVLAVLIPWGVHQSSRAFKVAVKIVGWLARSVRAANIDDQVEACRRVFASDSRWTVVRGSDLEKGESHGLPFWSRHVDDSSSRAI